MLPYPGMYPLRTIGQRQREKLAAECRLNPDQTLLTVKTLAQSLPDHVSDVQKQMKAEGLKHPLIGHLSEALIQRSQHCVKLLELRQN